MKIGDKILVEAYITEIPPCGCLQVETRNCMKRTLAIVFPAETSALGHKTA